jgi:hypothetical protein
MFYVVILSSSSAGFKSSFNVYFFILWFSVGGFETNSLQSRKIRSSRKTLGFLRAGFGARLDG